MPYTNTVNVIPLGGGPFPQISARLWMLWTAIGSGTGSGRQQMEQENILLQSSFTFTVSFRREPDYTSISRGIGLSIQDADWVGSDTGWWFRSGRFDVPLPTEPIEIILDVARDFFASDLDSWIPSPPFSVDADTLVTGLTATLAQNGIDFTATGTTTKTGVIVGFRYTGQMVLSPSPDVAAAGIEAFSVGVSNPAIVFLPGPSMLSAIEAELMNLLRVFIMREVMPLIRKEIERSVNTAVISSAGRSFPGGVLPPGVILSVRRVNVTGARIRVLAALGAFGGVFSKLPTPRSPAAQGDTMPPGELLNPDQSITSVSGQYTFIYQGDGNLVLYRNRDRQPLWASNTDGRPGGVCILWGDGNLVVYDSGADPVWTSNTSDSGSRLVVQDDGNVVIYRPDGTPVWATNTVQPVERWASLEGVATSDPGAVLQTGGRLVVFVRGTDNAIWHRWQMTRNGAWSGWESIGAPPGGATSGPDVALNDLGGLVVFARGGDNAIWHAWQDQPNGNWW